MNIGKQAWFALLVKVRMEKNVGRCLRGKGYEECVPLYKSRRKWADRYKVIDLPLFPGYVFCRFDFEKRLSILTTPGVFKVVGSGNGPTPVAEHEIETIKTLVTSKLSCQPWPYLEAGQRVRITAGPLAGVEGIFLDSRKGHRLVLSVSILQRSVSVEVDRSYVQPLERAPRFPLAMTQAASLSMA